MRVHVSLEQGTQSFGCIHKSGKTGSDGDSSSSFWRNLLISIVAIPVYTPLKRAYVPSSMSEPAFVVICFLSDSHRGEKEFQSSFSLHFLGG